MCRCRLIIALAGLASGAVPASATPMVAGVPTTIQAPVYCFVKQTPDGFVALRAGPDPRQRMIIRMRPGEELLIEGPVEGEWRRVHLMRRTGRDDGYFGPGRAGWMHSRYIERCY